MAFALLAESLITEVGRTIGFVTPSAEAKCHLRKTQDANRRLRVIVVRTDACGDERRRCHLLPSLAFARENFFFKLRTLRSVALSYSRPISRTRFNLSPTLLRNMSDSPKIITAHTESSFPNKGNQSGPGLDASVGPAAEHTKLERWDSNGQPYLVEYVGSGQLDGKKAIVTGRDSGIGRSVAVFSRGRGRTSRPRISRRLRMRRKRRL